TPIGLDGAFEFPPHKLVQRQTPINASLHILDPHFSGQVYDYATLVDDSLAEPMPDYPLIKTAVPSWDNDARRQGAGIVLYGATPARYEHWLGRLAEIAATNPFRSEPLLLVNAWNEWAE